MYSNLLYFNKYFYQINCSGYNKEATKKTKYIYGQIGYKANLFYRDFFSQKSYEKYDIVISFSVFKHFENLDETIKHTKFYLKVNAIILTMIPNMNTLAGVLQKVLNKKVYDIHILIIRINLIPYIKEDINRTHEKAAYKTLFCDYFGIYQAGVININNFRFEKLLVIPGKHFFIFVNFLKLKCILNLMLLILFT